MKTSLCIFSILLITFVSNVLSVEWYDCNCVPYDQCNIDYSMKEDAKDVHERRIYNDEKPRPTCNEPIDVCCDFKNQTQNVNKNNNHKWSCGLRGKGEDVDVGKISNAEEGEFPWVVAIFRNGYGYYAGGSLINAKAVLTSAHKVHKLKPSELIIHAGSCDLKSDKEGYYEGSVSSIHIHPYFEEESHINDYAVLILKESAKPSAKVNSICLADSDDMYDKSKCIVTGWGKCADDINENKGSHLQKSRVNVIENEKCEKHYRDLYKSYYKFHKSVICAGDDYWKDPCVGDAGNPIVCPISHNSKRYVQVGISSIGVCNENDKPGLYADVASGYGWIYQVVDSHGLKTNSFTT